MTETSETREECTLSIPDLRDASLRGALQLLEGEAHTRCAVVVDGDTGVRLIREVLHLRGVIVSLDGELAEAEARRSIGGIPPEPQG